MKNIFNFVVVLLALSVVTACGVISAKAINTFSFTNPAATGTIDEGAKTIAVTVPYGTDVRALVATFTTTGASVKVGTQDQVSDTTPNDFTGPVQYTVTALDGTTATYTATVTVGSFGTKAISAFSFTNPAATGTIDEGAKTIAVSVPSGTDVSALAAMFTTTGASVKVGTQDQVSGAAPNDFTGPVQYTVTAADGTIATYTVAVAFAAPPAITSFSFIDTGAMGIIDEVTKTISVTVPYGIDLSTLVATFTTTGATSIRVGMQEQLSGLTPNDFSSLVQYLITTLDGAIATYNVMVTTAPAPYYNISVFIGLGTGKGMVTSSPDGMDCRHNLSTGPCVALFPANTEVTLTATAYSGYEFKEWGGACEQFGSSTTCTLKPNTDRIVYVHFVYPGD